MKLAIVGSVSLEGNPEARRIIRLIIERYSGPDRDQDDGLVIVSGGAKGIDSMAEIEAESRGVPTMIFRPKIQSWRGPGGFKERNRRIAYACDRLVRIVAKDSTTYGSGWTADLARRLGKPVEEYVI